MGKNKIIIFIKCKYENNNLFIINNYHFIINI